LNELGDDSQHGGLIERRMDQPSMKNQLPAIEILEQSVNLLRASPQALTIYLAGAVPFTLALLFFLNDMMLSPYAFDHLATASLGLAALYVWKNTLQAIFAARLYRKLSPGVSTPSSSSPGASNNGPRPLGFFRVFLVQCTLQPVGLAIPLPFPWLTAFFRNVSMFAAIGAPDAVRTARRQAVLWTRQTWGVLLIVSLAFLLLFLNLLAMIVLLPELARSFLGIEGDFVRLGVHILYPTTVGVALAVAWMAIDPVLDAVFVLRCFYGESIATGEDLRAALQKALLAAVMIVFLLGAGPQARAQSPTGSASPAAPVTQAAANEATAINPADLDRSIDEVIHSREFTWRTPHSGGEEPRGKWVGWFRGAIDAVRRFVRDILDAISKWLNPDRETEVESGGKPVTRRMLQMMTGLVVALILGAAIAFFLRRRSPVTKADAVTAAAPAINLADESLTADQLPESSWLRLAEEWLAKGDCRLALRALHLAGLNFLGERGLVSIRRWKSGLDYRREVERRARAKPEIPPAFSNNVALFERGWYGSRPVDREMVDTFAARLTEIRNSAK
jgi:hypothetical protein